jgi:hypothetical protein
MNFSVDRRDWCGLLVEVVGALDQLVPARRRVDVDLDHARVGRDAEVREARVGGGS